MIILKKRTCKRKDKELVGFVDYLLDIAGIPFTSITMHDDCIEIISYAKHWFIRDLSDTGIYAGVRDKAVKSRDYVYIEEEQFLKGEKLDET